MRLRRSAFFGSSRARCEPRWGDNCSTEPSLGIDYFCRGTVLWEWALSFRSSEVIITPPFPSYAAWKHRTAHLGKLSPQEMFPQHFHDTSKTFPRHFLYFSDLHKSAANDAECAVTHTHANSTSKHCNSTAYLFAFVNFHWQFKPRQISSNVCKTTWNLVKARFVY